MRRFIADIVLFALLQTLVFVAVWRACPRRPDHYAAASIDKRARLAGAASPRFILVGGSSTAFGTDSRRLTAAGWSPVNMGHNVSLGLSFMLSQVEGELREGDVVVVSPEYTLLWGHGVDETLVTHLEHDPANLQYVDAATGRRLADAGLTWLARKLRCALHQVGTDSPIAYSRGSFDECGDFVAHRGRPPRPHTPLPLRWPNAPDLEPQLDRLRRFSRRCEETGAACYFAFSPIRTAQFEAGASVIPTIEAAVRDRSGLAVLLGPTEAVHPADQFFDAGLHLTEAAATARTDLLLERLEHAR